MPNSFAKKNKMRAAFASKCHAPNVQPAEEENSNSSAINDDENDEEETVGQPIPVQIGNRPGVTKPNYNRQLTADEDEDTEREAGFSG